MYQEQPWTLNVIKKEKLTKTKVRNKKVRNKKVKCRNNSLCLLILAELKNHPEKIINSALIMKKYGCTKPTALSCLRQLKKERKIKLVNVCKEGASLTAEYQSIKGEKEALKIAPQKGYMSVSSFLKKKKKYGGFVGLESFAKLFKEFLVQNKASSYIGKPSNRKLAVVYSVSDLENYYNKFTHKLDSAKKRTSSAVSKKSINTKTIPIEKEVVPATTETVKEEKVNSSPISNPIQKKGFKLFGITLFNKEISLNIH